MRGHESITINKFNGLWDRGNTEKVPKDHFSACQNLISEGEDVVTRPGIDWFQDSVAPIGNVVRIYNYITQDKNTLLILTYDGVDGKIYHAVNDTTIHGPLLTIAGMEDFGFVPFAGRAYITPFKSFLQGGNNPPIEKGLQNQFLYVYKGDGTAARKAAGNPPTGNITVANGAAGNTDPGFHLFGVVFESDTGWLSQPAAFTGFTTSASLSVSFTTVPISAQSHITKRHIVATKVIANYNGNTTGYEYFFIPNATINDNVTTSLLNISFFDADLLESADYLFDNFAEIPAGAGLNLFHNRLALWTTFADISLCYLSAVGEPEAISQVDGFLLVPLDGNPITNTQELRDLFYVMKRNRTVSYADNEDVPTSWPMTVIDQAIGCPVHGIATVIDSGGSNIDYLIVSSYKGIMLFNGKYINPELSWKVSNLWKNLNRNDFKYIQMLNDPILQMLYICLPNRQMLVGDYVNGMDPENIKWWPWLFDVKINTIALININEVIFGAEGSLV